MTVPIRWAALVGACAVIVAGAPGAARFRLERAVAAGADRAALEDSSAFLRLDSYLRSTTWREGFRRLALRAFVDAPPWAAPPAAAPADSTTLPPPTAVSDPDSIRGRIVVDRLDGFASKQDLHLRVNAGSEVVLNPNRLPDDVGPAAFPRNGSIRVAVFRHAFLVFGATDLTETAEVPLASAAGRDTTLVLRFTSALADNERSAAYATVRLGFVVRTPDDASGADSSAAGATAVVPGQLLEDSADFDAGDATDHLIVAARGQATYAVVAADDPLEQRIEARCGDGTAVGRPVRPAPLFVAACGGYAPILLRVIVPRPHSAVHYRVYSASGDAAAARRLALWVVGLEPNRLRVAGQPLAPPQMVAVSRGLLEALGVRLTPADIDELVRSDTALAAARPRLLELVRP